MDLLKATRMNCEYTLGMTPEGVEHVVVVIKGTYDFPPVDAPAATVASTLSVNQEPLVMADTFSGEPGFSAPIYESEFPLTKPRCDVILHGSAYAPGGQPAKRVETSLRVGDMKKSVDVVGPRTWKTRLGFIAATSPASFVRHPIGYEHAFGGVDKAKPDTPRMYPLNFAGKGYHYHRDAEHVIGKPLPACCAPGETIRHPGGDYKPMAYGPIARTWQPRPKWAGTYDQNWQDNVCPFLPADFDTRYNQCAPEDQQIDYPKGGEPVELINLTPQGYRGFRLPDLSMPVTFVLRDETDIQSQAVCDTIIIEPDSRRLMLVWRASYRLRRSIFEVSQIAAGRMSPAWYHARRTGREYYASLAAFIKAHPPKRQHAADDVNEHGEEGRE